MGDIAPRNRSAVRISGDYYQHLVSWNEVLEALRSANDVTAITVEHPDAGNVDDIVVHCRTSPGLYIQVKHAVDGTTPVGHRWLMTSSTSKSGAPSLLQKFHRSWRDLCQEGRCSELRLVTDREIDPNDPVMKRIDRMTELLVPDIGHGGASEGRVRWAQHLGITETELLEFLASLRFETGRSVRSQEDRAATLMWALGLNSDRRAIDSAVGMIRDWVLRRDRRLTADELWQWAQQRVGKRTERGSVVVIQAIDYDPHPDDADECITFVDEYSGGDAFERRELLDPSQWRRIGDDIDQAAERLRSIGVRRVVVRGAMRLPTWFAAGAAFRHVRGFEAAGIQNGKIWSSDDLGGSVQVDIKTCDVDRGREAAIAVGIAADPTSAVRDHIAATELPVGSLTTILPGGGPNPASIPDSPTAAAVAVAARDAVRDLLEDTPVAHIHLFLATPGALALLLGHRWNALRPTTVYEHLGTGVGYAPTFQIPS